MQRRARVRRRRRRLPAAAALTALALLLAPGDGIAADELVPLDPARLTRTDKLGFTWDPQVDGTIRNGSDDCFDGGLALKVNGQPFSPGPKRLMSKNAEELVVMGTMGVLEVTRRVRFDAAAAAARYVEVFKNTSDKPADVQALVYSGLGGSPKEAITNIGNPMKGGMFERGEYGVLAVQKSGDRPSVLFSLSAPGSAVDPFVEVKDERNFRFTWTLKVPAHRSVSILHSVAQRRYKTRPKGKALEAEFEPFVQPAWATGLPDSVFTTLANFGAPGAHAERRTARTPAHDEVVALAKAYGVERNDDAALFVERGKPLWGSVRGDKVRIATARGPVEVILEDVAVVRGGANVGRSMQLYLRNGEIFAGAVTAPGLTFVSKAGLEIPLDPAGIEALFTQEASDDGVAPDETESFLTQLDGTKIALGPAAGARLETATPWGDLELALADVNKLHYVRSPRPGLWVRLTDGSRFPLVVTGGALELRSLRFGALEIEPGAIAAWTRHGASPVAFTKFGNTTGPPAAHARLIGASYVVGRIDLDAFPIVGTTGEAEIAAKDLHYITRGPGGSEDAPVFIFVLRSGDSVRGRLRTQLVTLVTPRGRVRIPVLHLLGYRNVEAPGDGDDGKDGD